MTPVQAPLKEVVGQQYEQERGDEYSVCLRRDDPTLLHFSELCRNSSFTSQDMTNPFSPDAIVGAVPLGTEGMTDLLNTFLERGFIVPRGVVEKDAEISKLALCALPVQDGFTVVNVRVWQEKRFLAVPIMESITPEDFSLVAKMKGIEPYIGDLTAIAASRAVSEEADSIAGYMGGYPVGIVGGGKDIGIVVRYHPSPIIPIDLFAQRVNGNVIRLEDFNEVAKLFNCQEDGWSAAIAQMMLYKSMTR